MIEIVGSELNQWDVGRYVQITGIEAEYAHFANKGDSHAVVMGVVDIDAKIPDYLLQSGKQLCVYAVKDGITLESKTFYVKKRERPENYVYEDDRRNYIYELVENAESAIESMWWAYQDTNLATENANLAAENANNATDRANLAAKNANETAYKAEHTAKSLMVVGSAKGDNIHLDDAIDQFFVGMRIFGKTTQDGTPTPDAPVELESVENPTVTVNDQTLLLPYTLHGIPVASGGNYIDANGQQWICDEVDFARGVYVQRINTVDFENAVGTRSVYPVGSGIYRIDFWLADNPTYLPSVNQGGMCNALAYNPVVVTGNKIDNAICAYNNGGLFARCDRYKTANEFVAWAKSIDLKVQYALANPIETPLSTEELAAYAALRTHRGSTTVSNDASAHMDIEYVMDARTYIGRLMAGISSASRVASVYLPASKWAGSGNLYSQVVSIEGITEYSQVNLTPSVEQLSIFYEKDVTFITENDGGTVTVYVIGQKPTNDYTIKASIVEVVA